MPAEDGVGRDDARDLTEETSPDGFPFHCRSSTLVIGESQSLLAEQLPEHTVLFHHIAIISVSGAGGNRTPVPEQSASRVYTCSRCVISASQAASDRLLKSHGIQVSRSAEVCQPIGASPMIVDHQPHRASG